MPQNNEKNAIRKKIIIPANNIKSQWLQQVVQFNLKHLEKKNKPKQQDP